MSDIDTGAAPAAAESTVAPEVVETPAPLTSAPPPKAEEPAKPAKPDETPKEEKPSARDAIKAAREKIEAKEAAEKSKAPAEKVQDKAGDQNEKPVEKPKGDRDETGRFKAKEQEGQPKAEQPKEPASPSKFEAPKRFSPDAQRDWHTASDAVKAEVHRALRENEEGITKYKASHERYEQFRQFDEIAKSNGRDLRDSIEKLGAFEDAMQKNPLAAINYALREVGPRDPSGRPMTIDDIVEHVHGKSNDERLQAAHSEIAELRGIIGRMQAEQRDAEIVRRIPEEIEAFARDNPRVDELGEQIATLLDTGLAPDLATAYKLADMFMPATGAHTPEPKGAHTAKTIEHDEDEDLSAQTRKGSQSITGAPSVGSDPTRQQPSTSIKESLKRALARAG